MKLEIYVNMRSTHHRKRSALAQLVARYAPVLAPMLMQWWMANKPNPVPDIKPEVPS